ncbi:heavy-metal-associated domain-containing protein [Candidatus Poribacteria bacterium]|nr:heavy-metal-associated domain-containing protein [Candidatus Poribacteria bacterium]
MRKTLIVAAIVAVLGLGGYVGYTTIFCPAPSPSASAGDSVAFASLSVSGDVTCSVDGIGGRCCVGPVESALSRVEGVEKVECDPKSRTAKVTIAKGQSIPASQLAKVLKAAGYRLAGVEPL